jgi:hypothetical protein
MPKSAITYQLRLEERCEVRLRPHLPGHPCGMHTVFGAVGPGQRAVYDGLVLPDAKMPQGPLARVTGAALPVADGALERLPLLCATLTWSLSCASSRFLNQTPVTSHSSLSPLGPLKEPC